MEKIWKIRWKRLVKSTGKLVFYTIGTFTTCGLMSVPYVASAFITMGVDGLVMQSDFNKYETEYLHYELNKTKKKLKNLEQKIV